MRLIAILFVLALSACANDGPMIKTSKFEALHCDKFPSRHHSSQCIEGSDAEAAGASEVGGSEGRD